MLHPLPLEEVRAAGDLHRRLELNRCRLHDPEFQFDAMVTAFTAAEAPGDWVGRALLSLVLLERVGGESAAAAESIVARLPEVLNARGYIGEIHPTGTADENQLGGHNMLLRGLAAYQRWRGDGRSRAIIRAVITNLMVPSEPLWARYPDEPPANLMASEVVGLTVRQPAGCWRGLSTDIGAGFFALDGLTAAHGIEPRADLRRLIEVMIARYRRINPAQMGAQTHATLTALRGILRWWREVDPRPEYLDMVRERFALYRAQAVTEHHGNFNWFGRPEWTEPCAIVDAFMVAVQLWSATGDDELLEEAHRIYYNALSHAQRPNGGYGCDTCPGGAGQVVVRPHEFFEAPWCCSMRGSEGLAFAAQAGWFASEEGLSLPFYFGGTARVRWADGEVELEQTTDYPREGRVRLRVRSATTTQPKQVRWFAPSWSPAEAFVIRHNGQALPHWVEGRFAVVEVDWRVGDEIVAEFPVKFGVTALQNPARQPGFQRWAHGPWLLGVAVSGDDEGPARVVPEAVGPARYRCTQSGRGLEPLPALIDMSESDAKAVGTRLLFYP